MRGLAALQQAAFQLAPAGPVSLKPELSTQIAPTWASTADFTASSTAAGETATRHKSIRRPQFFKEATDGRPRISSPVGFTGTIVPWKPQ